MWKTANQNQKPVRYSQCACQLPWCSSGWEEWPHPLLPPISSKASPSIHKCRPRSELGLGKPESSPARSYKPSLGLLSLYLGTIAGFEQIHWIWVIELYGAGTIKAVLNIRSWPSLQAAWTWAFCIVIRWIQTKQAYDTTLIRNRAHISVRDLSCIEVVFYGPSLYLSILCIVHGCCNAGYLNIRDIVTI